MTEINVSDHNEPEDSGLIAAIIIFSGSLLITLAALVSEPTSRPTTTPLLDRQVVYRGTSATYGYRGIRAERNHVT